MATLAQNESKKVSQRVKVCQIISFENGVIYCNGNILGYDRVEEIIDKKRTVKMVINSEQASVYQIL